jgi:Cys2His2 zinc finger developmental/cell cycle regulator
MASQRFCLRWNNHQSNLLSVFDQLLHAETFTDVTLAIDGQYLKAHKVSLTHARHYLYAARSPRPDFFLSVIPYQQCQALNV